MLFHMFPWAWTISSSPSFDRKEGSQRVVSTGLIPFNGTASLGITLLPLFYHKSTWASPIQLDFSRELLL